MSQKKDPFFEETLQDILRPGPQSRQPPSSGPKPQASPARTRAQEATGERREPSRRLELAVRIAAAIVGLALLVLFGLQIANR